MYRKMIVSSMLAIIYRHFLQYILMYLFSFSHTIIFVLLYIIMPSLDRVDRIHAVYNFHFTFIFFVTTKNIFLIVAFYFHSLRNPSIFKQFKHLKNNNNNKKKWKTVDLILYYRNRIYTLIERLSFCCCTSFYIFYL